MGDKSDVHLQNFHQTKNIMINSNTESALLQHQSQPEAKQEYYQPIYPTP